MTTQLSETYGWNNRYDDNDPSDGFEAFEQHFDLMPENPEAAVAVGGLSHVLSWGNQGSERLPDVPASTDYFLG